MRIWERDPRQRQLTTLYLPQEPRRVMPSELADEIVLVHPAQPFASSFNEIRLESTIGATGAVIAVGLLPGTDRYFWVHSFSATHDDTTAREMQVGIRQDSTGDEAAVVWRNGVGAAQPLPSPRSLLIPQGYRLYARTNAIGAGSAITLRAIYLDLLEGEIAPQL